jgi:hypothetical protein
VKDARGWFFRWSSRENERPHAGFPAGTVFAQSCSCPGAGTGAGYRNFLESLRLAADGDLIIMSEMLHFLVSFDDEVSEAMGAAFERAWASLSEAGLSGERACDTRIHLARAILDQVHRGERDPSRLSESALASLAGMTEPMLAPGL